MKHYTKKQVEDAEEAVILLAKSLGIDEKISVEIICYGLSLNHNVVPKEKSDELLSELRATFDAYYQWEQK